MGEAQEFYRDMKARAAALGRDPGTLLIMPGWMPILAETDAEANRKFDMLDPLFPMRSSWKACRGCLGRTRRAETR